METITLESLKEGLTFKGDLVIDQNFILVPQSAEITPELIQALKEWEFSTIYCDGALSLGGDIGVNTLRTKTEEVKPVKFTAVKEQPKKEDMKRIDNDFVSNSKRKK